MQSVIDRVVAALILGGCLEIQYRRIIEVKMLDLTDIVITSFVITSFGFSSEDWGELNNQLFLSNIKSKS